MTLPPVPGAVSRPAARRKSIACPRVSTAPSLPPDVGFGHPPGAVAHSQMRTDSLFKLRCVGLDPSEDRRVVDLDAAVEEHELQITVADGKHQIPSHRPKDHLGCELAPLEAITQTHSDARPIVPHSIIPALRQQRSLQQNRSKSSAESATSSLGSSDWILRSISAVSKPVASISNSSDISERPSRD